MLFAFCFLKCENKHGCNVLVIARKDALIANFADFTHSSNYRNEEIARY